MLSVTAGVVLVVAWVAKKRTFLLSSGVADKGNKLIERNVIASYQIAQSLGSNGGFRAWEHLMRVHE
jgi:hypothetical protein